MWGGRLAPQILQLVKTENPDILCLQEAMDLPGGKGALFVTPEEIKEVIQAEHMFMSPVFTLNYMNRKAGFGNCIISKYPIIQTDTVFTAYEHTPDYDLLSQEPDMRNLQYARLVLPDRSELHLLNHHGHHNHQHKRGDEETLRQCGIIADYAKNLDQRVLVNGDFNLDPDSESLGLISSLFTNLSVEAGLETTRTQLTHKTEVCDYIFAGKDIKVGSFAALDEVVSDHKALVLNFS